MFIFLLLLPVVRSIYVISLYGDVHNDVEFFTRTFPWLVDNIGGDISVDYYLLGSGKYSIPQMCALEQMKLNTFLQAQYLKCEAEGHDSVKCLCATGIDPQRYSHCVMTKGSYASHASSKYQQLNIDASPIIEIGYKNTVFAVEDSWYLKKICTIFGDNPPRGCVVPFACNTTDVATHRSGVAFFDCNCIRHQCGSMPAATTSTTPYADYPFRNNREFYETTYYG
ncbi:uncharacterized protein LOC119837290 [Zerene cesonia]|uniref:uncharacterized protein LOC119837290 n=1 Tax=Zerene cesonia TaxID=33412 RepID=UPI0018E57AE9|nr:uncharacterized protein LOC119837290 [Zerene cesonia]